MEREQERDLEYMEIKWDCHVRGHKYRGEWYFTVMDGCGNYWNGEQWEADDEYCGESNDAGMPDRDAVLAQFEAHGTMPDHIALNETRKELTAAVARAEKAEAERDAYAKAKAENDERFQVEAGTWKALYAKCKAEADCARFAWEHDLLSWHTETQMTVAPNLPREWEDAERAHDATRKEAGL